MTHHSTPQRGGRLRIFSGRVGFLPVPGACIDRGPPMSRVVPQPDLLAKLGPVTLPEAEGKRLRIGDLWAHHTLILVHLRHFG